MAQLQRHNPDVLQGASADPKTAPVGINPVCAIPFVAVDGSLANIANIIACGLSVIFLVYLIWATSRRKAAVGESPFLYWSRVPCSYSRRRERCTTGRDTSREAAQETGGCVYEILFLAVGIGVRCLGKSSRTLHMEETANWMAGCEHSSTLNELDHGDESL